MITDVLLEAVGSPGEPGTNEVLSLRITATFDTPGETDTLTVSSLRSTGALLSVNPKGPFEGSLLGKLSMPAATGAGPDYTSTRTVYIRPGLESGEELLRVRSETDELISAKLLLEFPEVEAKEVAPFVADGLYASVSSFFDLFEDRHILSSFWHGMALGADDLAARSEVASRSSKIWEIPVFSTRKWQKFEFSDETGIFDAQTVQFKTTSDGIYGYDASDPLDDNNEASWNTADRHSYLLTLGPSGFGLQAGSTDFDAGERAQIDEAGDASAFFRSTTAEGQGPVTVYRFPLRQLTGNVMVLAVTADVKGWGNATLSSGAVVEVWNNGDEVWESVGQTAETASDPGSHETIRGALFGDNVADYVDGSDFVNVRVRSSQASQATGADTSMSLSVDRVSLSVGTINRASRPLVSPAGTSIAAVSTNFEVRDPNSDTVYVEGTDYYIDYTLDQIVWLNEYDAAFSVFVVFDADYPMVYSIDETAVTIPELRKEILLEPATVLRDGVDYVLSEPGLLRMDGLRHHPGATADWWAPRSLHDDQLIFKNFGILTSRLDDEASSVRYLRRIQGLWYSFWSGPSVFNVESGAQILMDAPFAFDDTRVTSIDGNTMRLGNGQVVSKPSPTPWAVQVGDSVSRFQPLTKGVRIVDKVVNPGFTSEAFAVSLIEENLLGGNPPPTPVASLVTVEHMFTAEVDGFSLAQGGATLKLVEDFLNAIKPVHTYQGLGLVLAADCGEIIEGPCGFESTGNCLCVITPPPYDLDCEVASFYDLDVSEYLQRNPYLNESLGAVQAVDDLPGAANNGDGYYVRDEGAYYVWYEPQALPGPTINLGRYKDSAGDWQPRIPDLHSGYPLDSWSYAPNKVIEADDHSAGQPPFDQWQWGGSWIKVVGERFDLPRRTNYAHELHFRYSIETGTEDTSGCTNRHFVGTAKDVDLTDIGEWGGQDYSAEAHSIIGGQTATTYPGADTLGPARVVSYVREVRNLSRGITMPADSWELQTCAGLIVFDPAYQGAIGESGKYWENGESLEIDYRVGIALGDQEIGSEVGNNANVSLYTSRADLEHPELVPVSGESATVAGLQVTLANPPLTDWNVQIVNITQGAGLSEGADYTVDYGTGVVTFVAGVINGDTVESRYVWEDDSDPQRPWKTFDQAYDLDGDFPCPVVFAVQWAKNGNINAAPQFDTAGSHYTTVLGRIPVA